MKRINSYLKNFVVILTLFAVSACGGGGGGGGGLEAPVADLSGTGKITASTISNNCGDTNGISGQVIITVVQNGNNITFADDQGNVVLKGTISGNQIVMTGSFPIDGGTTTVTNLLMTVSEDTKSSSGTASWRWTDGFDPCQGKSSVTVNFTPSNVSTPAPTVTADPLLSTVTTIGSSIQGLTFDDRNNLYVSTVSGKVVKLDGNSLSTFIPEGVGGLDFNRHIRFSQGNFYVMNVLNVGTELGNIDEVLLFDNTGKFIRRLLDENTVGASSFRAIAVNAQGQVYVAPRDSSSNDVVIQIDANGQNLTNIVQSGVAGVVVPTSLVIDSKGNLYVGEPREVSKFDANGVFLKKVAEEGVTPGFKFANNLAVDSNDNLYVGNLTLGSGGTSSTWNVLRFDSSGVFQGEFIPNGAGGLGPFPDDMGFDIQGRLYIADREIVRFDPAGNLDRVGAKSFKVGSNSKPSVLKRAEEKERHYRELEIKNNTLAEEFSRGF